MMNKPKKLSVVPMMAIVVGIVALASVSAKTTESPSVTVPIFLYHHVKPGRHALNVQPNNFEAQMRYLSENGYNSITVEDLAESLRNGKKLPPKPVLLTFDDTLRNQYENAFPIMKKYGIVGTLYVSSDVVGGRNSMTWEQIREMRDYGISIGSHSRWHPWLTKLSDARLRSDLVVSKRILEEKLGQPVTSFAYPFGAVDGRVRAAVIAAGYASARGVKPGLRHGLSNIYGLHCFDPTDSLTVFVRILERKK